MNYLYFQVQIFILVSILNGSHQENVIVVGSGISGLAAARTLVDHGGYNVTVLEANADRYGGRVWSNRDITSDGSAIDLGASFIHDSSDLNPIRQLADRIGLDLLPVEYVSFVSAFDEATGTQFPFSEIAREYVNFVSSLSSLHEASLEYEEDTSVLGAAELEGILPDWVSPINQMFVHVVETSQGGPQNNLSIQLLSAIADFLPYGGKDVIFPNGYIDVLDFLVFGNTTQEPLDVRLGQTVTRVNVDDVTEQVLVETSSGDVYLSDHVIVTVPLGILKSTQIEFSPPLPENKQQSIIRLGFGILNKIILEFDEAFWEDTNWLLTARCDSTLSGGMFFNKHSLTGSPVLIAFSGGQAAIDEENLSDSELVQITVDHLSNMLGYNVMQNHTLVSSARTRWMNNPYSLGSYSFPAVDGSIDDWDILSLPVCPSIYFAGEHTNSDRWSTVDGAYSSGLRAAQEIIDGSACESL